MVHKPGHKVHSFRGLLADGGQDEINLERSNVNLAYRIVKFSIIGTPLGLTGQESTIKIYKEEQTAIDSAVDFSNPDLLGVGYWSTHGSDTNYPDDMSIIFANDLFSRNIFVTHFESNGSASCNYYIELEEVPVGAATLMQLKLGVARKLSLSQNPS